MPKAAKYFESAIVVEPFDHEFTNGPVSSASLDWPSSVPSDANKRKKNLDSLLFDCFQFSYVYYRCHYYWCCFIKFWFKCCYLFQGYIYWKRILLFFLFQIFFYLFFLKKNLLLLFCILSMFQFPFLFLLKNRDDELLLCLFQMFTDLGLVAHFNIPATKLQTFLLRVRKSYRFVCFQL